MPLNAQIELQELGRNIPSIRRLGITAGPQEIWKARKYLSSKEKHNSSSSTDSSMEIMEMSDKEFRTFVTVKLTEMEEKRDKEL